MKLVNLIQLPLGTSKSISQPLALSVCLATLPVVAQAVPLTFDQMIGQPTGFNLLGSTAPTNTILFRDVATDNGQTVDARVTATLIGDTHFADINDPNAQNYFGDSGFIPDYRNRSGGPQDDLGFLYYGNGINDAENGLDMMFEFFDGTGDLAGTFLDPLTLSSLEIAIYDVDGEASQSEYFTAQRGDGLVSYATGSSSQALVATEQGDSIRFDGPGTNYAEDDATGAAVLYYELTDKLQLSFGSVQTSGPEQNAVFSAIDGDLSLFGTNNFGDPVSVNPVPLPAGGLLLLSGLFGLFITSKRASKNGTRGQSGQA
ncbi:MAG: hypothetical protein ABJH45_06490 [Paracoccaceae bacterium]